MKPQTTLLLLGGGLAAGGVLLWLARDRPTAAPVEPRQSFAPVPEPSQPSQASQPQGLPTRSRSARGLFPGGIIEPIPPGPQSSAAGDVQLVLQLTNSARARGLSCGPRGSFSPVGPLVWNSKLAISAAGHAKDMALKSYFAHQSQDGRAPTQRMQAAGFNGRIYGENIYAGSSNPADAVAAWINSPSHCENMMIREYTQLGVGYYALPAPNSMGLRYFWVQNFGG